MMVKELVVPQPHVDNNGNGYRDTLPMTLESMSQNLMYVLLGEINNRVVDKTANLEEAAKKLGWSVSKTYRVKDSDIKKTENLSRVILLAQACNIECDVTISIKK